MGDVGRKRRFAGQAATCILAAAALLGAGVLSAAETVGAPIPEKGGEPVTAYRGGFDPSSGWGLVQPSSDNPDVVGWVKIEGTNINQPILKARASDPEFYLSHDALGQESSMGCACLDAGCEEAGFSSQASFVFGHNWANGGMFADFAMFSTEEYAREHQDITLQTPDGVRELSVQCVEVAQGDDLSVRTAFGSREEFRCWYQTRYASSCVKLAPEPSGDACPDSVVAFYTCSYNFSDDERTVVYAA